MELSLYLEGKEVLRFEPRGESTIGDIQKALDLLNGESQRFEIRATRPFVDPLKTFGIADKEGDSDVWLIGDCLVPGRALLQVRERASHRRGYEPLDRRVVR